MTFEDTLRSAIAAQEEGDLEEAGRQFSDILKQTPEHPDALHYYGMFLNQCGKPEEAIAMIQRSLEISPNQASAFNNLGSLHRMQGREDEADNAFWNAVRIDSGHVEAWRNISEVRRLRNDPVGAIKALRAALAFDPDSFSSRHRLGTLLAGIGEFDEAAEIFIAIVRDGLHTRGNVITYADILAHHGKPEKALELVLEWQRQDPLDPLAAHHVAAHRGLESSGASEAYVREIFDGFAETFDDVLGGLDYGAPAQVADAVLEIQAGRRIGAAVDLGCGTGLVGARLKPVTDTLAGVDLSPKMLEEARRKGVYDSLHEEEITAFLQAQPDARYDLITAADVMIYVGDIRSVTLEASRTLKPGGLYAVSYELLEDAAGFRLLSSGRYGHSKEYVEALRREAGLDQVTSNRIALRKSYGDTIEGFLVVLRKPE